MLGQSATPRVCRPSRDLQAACERERPPSARGSPVARYTARLRGRIRRGLGPRSARRCPCPSYRSRSRFGAILWRLDARGCGRRTPTSMSVTRSSATPRSIHGQSPPRRMVGRGPASVIDPSMSQCGAPGAIDRHRHTFAPSLRAPTESPEPRSCRRSTPESSQTPLPPYARSQWRGTRPTELQLSAGNRRV
jgi:hypothetical protein